MQCLAAACSLQLAACSFLPLVGWQRGRVQRLWESKSKSKRESSRAWPSRQCNGRACTGSEPPWDARGAAQGRHRQDQCRVFAACFAIESVAASAGRACAGAVFYHFLHGTTAVCRACGEPGLALALKAVVQCRRSARLKSRCQASPRALGRAGHSAQQPSTALHQHRLCGQCAPPASSAVPAATDAGRRVSQMLPISARNKKAEARKISSAARV